LASGASLDQFYERSVMTAADARCGLFAEPVAAALAAGQAQARGAALRAGVAPETLSAAAQRARQAADRAACDSSDRDLAAARVRSAFEGYAKRGAMTYRSDLAEWRAERSGPGPAARWRLSQSAGFGADRVVFGLAGRDRADLVLALASFQDGA